MAFQPLLRDGQQKVFHCRLRARALYVADKIAERILQAQTVRADAACVPAERKRVLRQRLNGVLPQKFGIKLLLVDVSQRRGAVAGRRAQRKRAHAFGSAT